MSRSRFALARLVVAFLALAPLSDGLAAQPEPRRILTRRSLDKIAVLMALNGAQRKLRIPKCRMVLADFHDADGRSLEENLAALDVEPADYITMLTIRDGGERQAGALCRMPGVAAVTSPRGRVVYVCAYFRLQPAGTRENTLIHEMLHTLGLGENPPRAIEISDQVRRRCGS